jgi:hypothetical protein
MDTQGDGTVSTDVAEKLAAIADEIEQHPERWTQGELARDVEGDEVPTESAEAACWCAWGWIDRVTGEYTLAYHPAVRALSCAVRADIIDWNDAPGRTAAEVAAAFRRASAIAKGESA